MTAIQWYRLGLEDSIIQLRLQGYELAASYLERCVEGAALALETQNAPIRSLPDRGVNESNDG